MGYYQELENSDFRMTPRNQEKARDAILEKDSLMLEVIENNSLMYHFTTPLSFQQLMKCLSWSIRLNTENDCVSEICYSGEKASDTDFALFTTIAPFVEDDSFIEMKGEDGYRWRWWFRGGLCKELDSKTIWQNFDESWESEE
jgi:hypothetical protein